MFDALMSLRPDIMALAQRPGALGRVFWVHRLLGSDAVTNSGEDPSSPLATITRALALCTHDHNDYILVLSVWEEAGMPIAINKRDTHIIGIGGSLANPSNTLRATGNTAIFSVGSAANGCEIAGFNLGGGNAHGAIENVGGLGTPSGLHIHHCQFGHSFTNNTPLYGIEVGSNATAIDIHDCIFLGNGNNSLGVITADGIHWATAAPNLNGMIHNNLFMGLPGIAISINRGTGLMILKNIIALDANTAGAGITLLANCLGCLVAENEANFGDTAMAQNPYDDAAGAGANTWVANKSGGGGLANTAWALPA